MLSEYDIEMFAELKTGIRTVETIHKSFVLPKANGRLTFSFICLMMGTASSNVREMVYTLKKKLVAGLLKFNENK